ncbi:MAG: hypothetical protein AAF125_04485 [Chloroflexota bacterium]
MGFASYIDGEEGVSLSIEVMSDSKGDMDEDLKAYEYLWTTEKRDWVLLTDEESQREKDFVLYHIKTWRMLDVGDKALHKAIVAKMIDAGIPQVTDEDVFGKK